MPFPTRAAAGLLMLLPTLAYGQGLGRVEVQGLGGEQLQNVRLSLSLVQLPEEERKTLTEARLSYLLRRVPAEVDQALQPYGYYAASVESRIERRADGVPDVVLEVTPGEPVKVAASQVVIDAPAAEDPVIDADIEGFRPRIGEVFDHRRYEASKLTLQRSLLARGYFDAELRAHRVEVSRKALTAKINLDWIGGKRYRFGETRFEGSHVREDLLHKAVPYKRGAFYEQSELLKLHQRLTDLDYFGYIDARPDVENADGDEVPIAISLLPGKRSVYTAGLSFGTDSGAGVQLGLERRWVNSRGHKFGANLDWAQRRKSLGAEYRIPAFAWAEGWYAFGANRREEESDVLKTRITELVASRSGAWRGWNLNLAMHMRTEDFEIGHAEARRDGTATVGESRLVYPALSAQRVVADDPMYPSRGFSLRGEFKIGAEALASDVNFGQFLLDAKLIRSVGSNNRFLFRGQLGRTFTDQFDQLPPSLRFFAGGDRSIRGYGYQEIAPRQEGVVLGGKNLLVGSAEYERMFSSSWGAAVFVDAGNAFNEVNEGAYVGAGAGVRWRSPVGMVRLDLAHGFKDADNSIQLHINIGPDL